MAVKTETESVTGATRQQLLEAAAEVFADVGFRNATVREICLRAGANIAAINYHFGDKEKLYQAVLKETAKQSRELYPETMGLDARSTPEDRLHAFVLSFLLRIFADGHAAGHGRLMAREMIEPTGALDNIVKEDMHPRAEILRSIIRDLAGQEIDVETIRMCSMSVVSQVTFYNHCRPVLVRMFPEMRFDRPALEKLAKHITRFSLAAIKEIVRSKEH